MNIVLIVLIVAIIAFVWFLYNSIIVAKLRISEALSQIDVQLKRRADLIPNLVETVKGYAKHEKSTIKEVTDARKALIGAKGLPERVKANDKLESALGRLFAIAENYPNLKANENFLELQRELTTTEDKISYARQYYNDNILNYNDLCKTFPGVIFAGIFGKKPREYLHIAEAER